MNTIAASHVELRIPRKPEYVRMARRTACALAADLDFTYDAVKDIELAVGEACTNALEHAEQPRRQEILLRFIVDQDSLTVEVIDYGEGFAHSSDPQGGLGLVVIRSIMDQVDVLCDCESGTCVRMTKHRTGA